MPRRLVATSSTTPTRSRYSLLPEQAIALTDESSPAYLPGFFQIALGSVLDSPRITEIADSGTASAGTSTSMTSTRAASASSALATTLTSSPSGCLL